MTPADLAAARALVAAATPGPWHWAGNTDSGEPYLATWIPGAGRCQVLSIGSEERSTSGRAADQVRSDAKEFDLGDPEELVQQWATDNFGEPVRDPRLQFVTDLMCVNARELVVYEVAPEATSRDDKSVYRADIVDIRHPDAALIAAAPHLITRLLDHVDRLEADASEALERGFSWEGRARTAETERDRYAAQVQAIRDLHKPSQGHNPNCDCGVAPNAFRHCLDCAADWPCPTTLALGVGVSFEDSPRGGRDE